MSPRPIKAKLDTGARTSALHAFRLKRFVRGGQPWVRFELHPGQYDRKNVVVVEAPVLEERSIRSSNGTEEQRPVIVTRLSLNSRIWKVELTLTRRDSMSYRLLLGRTALRSRVLVDSGRSHLIK